jgi:hypothetical protein
VKVMVTSLPDSSTSRVQDVRSWSSAAAGDNEVAGRGTTRASSGSLT